MKRDRHQSKGTGCPYDLDARAKAKAVEEARKLAMEHHRRTGVPTGVRVQGLDTRWWEDCAFGDEGPVG